MARQLSESHPIQLEVGKLGGQAEPNVLIVDGSQAYCAGLGQFFRSQGGAQLVGCINTGARIRPSLLLRADVAIVEMEYAGRSGLTLCRELIRRDYPPKVLMLINHDWDVSLAAAYASGACGVLFRSTPPATVLQMVGQASACPVFTEAQMQRIQQWEKEVGTRLRRLRRREWQLLWLVATGPTNDEIAEELGVTRNTVEKHIGAMLTKLELGSRAALFGFMFRYHLDVLTRLMYDEDSFIPWLNAQPTAILGGPSD